ncbi:radical SAM protein [Methylosinus sp. PW1]|uniref:radical SAM protein n=1 Tax=Methylosinus sp. PW1 TaxID=107636 RepID=UPI00056918E8|nr:radical SAM protein [Methylosinus sp. PW1]
MAPKRNVRISTIWLAGAVQHCAHACSYCSIGDKAGGRLPLEHFLDFVMRFARLLPRDGDKEVKVHPIVHYSYEYGAEGARRMEPMRRAFGLPTLEQITTGGLRLRDEAQSRAWLRDWRDFGVRTIHATFAGMNETHDSYNGRRGDFDYLWMLQKVAAELGMELGQSLLLTKTTAPRILELVEKLKTLNAPLDHRWVFPPAYMGHGKALEADRIGESERDTLPRELCEMRSPHFATWRSEREWLKELATEQTRQEEVFCNVRLDVSRIQAFETKESSEITKSLIDRARRAYEAIPPLGELAREFGDRTNERIYLHRYEIERLLVDRFLISIPTSFERDLTEL